MLEYNGYIIDLDGAFGLRVIKSKGSGALPNALKGSYTTEFLAKRSIDFYLATKELNDVKEVSTRRS